MLCFFVSCLLPVQTDLRIAFSVSNTSHSQIHTDFRAFTFEVCSQNSQNIFREAAELFDWAFSNPDLQPKAAAPETKKHSLFSFWQNLLG